ncbi:hypothetical protein BH09PSE2_BH09PSE2_15180 [soil metagenome]
MRAIVIAAAVLFAGAGAASAQTRGLAPYSSQIGDPSQVQTGRGANMPGPAARPGMETARLGPHRGRPMMHHGVSARVCVARANARNLHGRAKTRFVHYCQIGRR